MEQKTSASIAQENIILLDCISREWTPKERLELINGLAVQIDKYIFESPVIDQTKDPAILNVNQMIAVISNVPDAELENLRDRFKKYISNPKTGFFFMG